jgi:hypothetical protein
MARRRHDRTQREPYATLVRAESHAFGAADGTNYVLSS